MAATDARPVPRKNIAYRVTFPILDADGDLVTGAAALDSEVSINGGTFADVTAEATEIATSSGVYFLDLTAAEMNGDTISIIVKTTTTGAKTTVIVMYPEEVGDYRVNVEQFGGTTGTFAAGRPEVNTSHVAGTTQTANDIGADVDAILVDTGTTLDGRIPAALVAGRMDSSVGAMATGVIAAASFGAGAINAAAIATGAIDADAIALDAANEILGAISGTADSGTTTTLVDTERTEADTDYWAGALITFTSGTLNGQSRLVTAFNAATDTLTFAPATTVAVLTHTYRLIPHARVDLHLWAGVVTNALIAGRVDANAQVVGDKGGYSIGTGGIVSGSFAAGAIDAAAIAANAIGASEIAANAIDADALATDAVNEIRDAIRDLAMVEPTAIPAVTATLRDTLSWLLVLSRNKVTQTSTTQTLRNDADAASIGTSTHSDDGTTHTRGEWV